MKMESVDRELSRDGDYPLLLTRKQAAEFLGIDGNSFDKYFRHRGLRCFMVGRRERYLTSELVAFVQANLVA
ncbi:DNA-binding protein [Lacticaseibacillus saniviri]